MAARPAPVADVAAALALASAALAHLETPRSEAQSLVAALLGRSRSQLLAFPEWPLAAEDQQRLQVWLARRAAGEPLAYLTGRRGFRDLDLCVRPGVLVPRPETEGLVEAVLERLPAKGTPTPVALDLGTGSGAIALAAARARPDVHWLATDASAIALETAAGNARQHAIGNVEFRAADWWSGLEGQRFHLVVSNPPYLAPGEPELAGDGLSQEPREALVGGCDGLRDIARIVAGAPAHLLPGACLLIEHGHRQAAAVQALMRGVGLVALTTRADLSGLPRFSLGWQPDPAGGAAR